MDFPSRPNLCRRLSRALAVAFIAVAALAVALPAHADEDRETLPEVRVATTEGAFNIRLRPDIAPKTVDNFLQYVDEGFYDGTIFHRVIPGFMVQGGGFEPGMEQKATGDAVENESRQTAKNLRGSIAMARTADPDSATAQFFVNLVDNPHLDATRSRPGYTVFATVTEGMGVIDAIANVKTSQANGMSDVPTEPVIIESIRRLDNE